MDFFRLWKRRKLFQATESAISRGDQAAWRVDWGEQDGMRGKN
jgi:hypothetical protein